MSEIVIPLVNYKQVMAAIAAGEPVSSDAARDAAAYAKLTKKKSPDKSYANFVPTAEKSTNGKAKSNGFAAKKTAAKKTAAKKTAAPAEKAPRVKQTACNTADCKKAHYSKGFCVAHYAQNRRQDPAERAKANEASKQYRERQRAAVAVTAAKK